MFKRRYYREWKMNRDYVVLRNTISLYLYRAATNHGRTKTRNTANWVDISLTEEKGGEGGAVLLSIDGADVHHLMLTSGDARRIALELLEQATRIDEEHNEWTYEQMKQQAAYEAARKDKPEMTPAELEALIEGVLEQARG